MITKFYPLKFENLTRDYYFGGRRIAEFFNRKLPEGIIAETWELSDHSGNPGIVQNGFWSGCSLHSLIERYGADLMGSKKTGDIYNRFPLLLKFLDVHQYVLLQIHPNDEFCKRHGFEDSGKAEAWHILWAEPNAVIYYGTRHGVNLADISTAIDENRVLDLLQPIPVKAGDTIYIPPGRIHAIGAGILLFEIQQNSDVTIIPEFLFLHGVAIEESRDGIAKQMFLDQIRLEEIPQGEEKIRPLAIPCGENKRIFHMACNNFALEEWHINSPWKVNSHPDKFVAFTTVEGQGQIIYDGGKESYQAGRTIFIPAKMGDYQIVPSIPSHLLCSYVPDLFSDVITPLRHAGFSDLEITGLGGYGVSNDLISLMRCS